MKRIIINPNIRFGKPCFEGTRIAVTDILDLIAAGYALTDIPKQYPGVTTQDVIAAITFTSELVDQPTHLFTQKLALS